MTFAANCTYLRQTRDAVGLLGKLNRRGGEERKMTEEDLPGRAGISRRTLQKIERGDPKCELAEQCKGESSAVIAKRVEAARDIQLPMVLLWLMP